MSLLRSPERNVDGSSRSDCGACVPPMRQEFFRELCDEATTSIERVKEVVPGVSQWGDIQCASRCRPADRTKVPFAAVLECALDGGQFQAAVLTGCWACRSSYCAGLR